NQIPTDHEQLLEALLGQDVAKIEELWIHHISRRDSLRCFDDIGLK
ncbi:MAG: hypothetical protein K0R28_4114, partial [Paenibacillus sp.]|nr:hypothetical protein [Paenibacillus sp.]